MNIKFASALAGMVLAAVTLSAGGAAAFSLQNKPAFETIIHTAAITPLSMQYFCAQNKSECGGGGRSQVTMMPKLMSVLKQVNVHVNRTIHPERDTADTWELNPTSGDCEDYVLTKRSLLIRNGVSAGALRIAYTHTRRGEPHAVLIVRTNEGDYVLDNLNNSVKTLASSGYNIRSMSTANPTKWTAS